MSKLEVIPGAAPGFYSLGYAVFTTRRDGREQRSTVRDSRFSNWCTHAEAEWLLRNELGAEERARLYASRRGMKQ